LSKVLVTWSPKVLPSSEKTLLASSPLIQLDLSGVWRGFEHSVFPGIRVKCPLDTIQTQDYLHVRKAGVAFKVPRGRMYRKVKWSDWRLPRSPEIIQFPFRDLRGLMRCIDPQVIPNSPKITFQKQITCKSINQSSTNSCKRLGEEYFQGFSDGLLTFIF
jgi:hypothetical protein